MDRLYDLAPELDSIGLELPFSETPEPESPYEMLTTDSFDESPFAEAAIGETSLYETPEAADQLDFEQESGTRHEFKGCTPADKKLLIASADRSVHAVRHAAAFVGSAHGNPKRMSAATRQLLLTHFHTVRQRDLRVILTRLQKIAKAFDDGVKFLARRKCDASKGRMTCGYANNSQWFGGFGRVEICFDTRAGHCNFPAQPSDYQDATVIHEVAHRYVELDDKAYRDLPEYAGLSAGAAMDNADSYAFFAVEAIGALSEAGPEQAGEWSSEEFQWTGEEFEWRGDGEGPANFENFEQDQSEIDRLLQTGDVRGAIRAAINAGEHDEGKLTNLVFFFRHPELDRTRPLQPKTNKTDAALANEWARISRSDVWPAIVDFARDPQLAVDGQQIAGRITHFRGQAGKRFKQLIEAAARKVDLNPGLIAAALIGETGGGADYLTAEKVSSYRVGVDDFYDLRGILAKNVPAYADVHWDRKQAPRVHLNDAKTNQRAVKTIWFDSGPDALLATAVYLKYAEVRLRSDAMALGGNFDTLPVEVRFALIRMSMAAGRAGAAQRLQRALKGQDILIRNWAPPRIYQTERNATIRAAEAMFLSGWVFGQSLTPTTPVRPQPEQFETTEAERPPRASWDQEQLSASDENEELAWLDYEGGGLGQSFEEEGGLGAENLESGFRDAEWTATQMVQPEAGLWDRQEAAASERLFETRDLYPGEESNAGPAVPQAEAGISPSATMTASVGAGGLNRHADVLHVQAALVIRARQDGAEQIRIDGIVGAKTIAAISDYQRRKALIVDGRVDTGGPTIKSLEDGLIATASALIGAEVAAILQQLRHAVLPDSVSTKLKEAYRRALRTALALLGSELPVGSAPAPLFAAAAAAPAVALGVVEMMMLALLAALAMLVIIQNLPRMGKTAEELIRKIQVLIAALLDGVKAHVDSVEELVRRNTRAGMRCSAELILFRSLSGQLVAELSAPRLPSSIEEERRRIRIANLFNKWKAALAALFRCLDEEPPVAAFGEGNDDLGFRDPEWASAEWLGSGEAELFDPEDREDGEQIPEAAYPYSSEGTSAPIPALEALARTERALEADDDELKDLAPLFAAPTLRRGASGAAVKSLQCALVRLGCSTLGIDSQFGTATEEAVRQFQSALGLVADGAAGPQTKAAVAFALGAKKKAAPKGPPNGQIDLAGFFVWDPPISDADEKNALASGRWHPATVDFLAVMGSSANQGMGNFPAILGQIVRWPAGTVKRVNFMTHSNNKTLGIRGHNDLTDVWFDVSITDQDIDNLGAPGLSFTVGTRTFTIQDVRDRFAPGAVLVIYGCRSGLNVSVLKALNKLLGIKVVSFKNEIVFCPPRQNQAHFVRNGMKIGVNKAGFQCSADATKDWRALINHPDAVSVP